jgi:hypothetical protein
MISFGGTIYSSLPIIASQISLFVLTYLTVVSVPAENHNIYEPSMPALMKASSTLLFTIEIASVQLPPYRQRLHTLSKQRIHGISQKCRGTAVHTRRLTIYSQYSQPKLIHWQHLK